MTTVVVPSVVDDEGLVEVELAAGEEPGEVKVVDVEEPAKVELDGEEPTEVELDGEEPIEVELDGEEPVGVELVDGEPVKVELVNNVEEPVDVEELEGAVTDPELPPPIGVTPGTEDVASIPGVPPPVVPVVPPVVPSASGERLDDLEFARLLVDVPSSVSDEYLVGVNKLDCDVVESIVAGVVVYEVLALFHTWRFTCRGK
jgi:hypothetical protein